MCSPNSKCFWGIASTSARHSSRTIRIENCLAGAIRNNTTQKLFHTTWKRLVSLCTVLEEFLEAEIFTLPCQHLPEFFYFLGSFLSVCSVAAKAVLTWECVLCLLINNIWWIILGTHCWKIFLLNCQKHCWMLDYCESFSCTQQAHAAVLCQWPGYQCFIRTMKIGSGYTSNVSSNRRLLNHMALTHRHWF